MPKKPIARPESFADYDAEEVEAPRFERPHMPMDEANGVMDGTLPSSRYIAPKVLLEQEQAKSAALEEEKELWRHQAEQLQGQLMAQSSGLMVQEGGLVVQGFQFTPTGLIAPDNIDQTAWKQVGALLHRLEGSIQWLIGDWLVCAESVEWGDATAIAKELGYEPGTIHSYASVCRAVNSLIRIKELSFAHHRLVMTYEPDEQARLLAHAVREDMSVAKFRKYLEGNQPTPALSTSNNPAREEFYDAYMPETNRFFFGVERIEELPPEHRKDASLRAQWLADYYSGLAKQLKGGN